jgi:hypothetical protein
MERDWMIATPQWQKVKKKEKYREIQYKLELEKNWPSRRSLREGRTKLALTFFYTYMEIELLNMQYVPL